MPALASRSLWEGTTTPLGQLTVPPPVVTGTAFPLWGTQGSPVTISLFVQTLSTPVQTGNPNNPSYFSGADLVSPVSLVVTFPDKSMIAFTSTSTPAIVHTANSGQYNLYMNSIMSGRYGYAWYQAGELVFSGEFFATPQP